MSASGYVRSRTGVSFPGLDEPGEGEQLFPQLFVREQLGPLSDETVDHDSPKNGAHRPDHAAG